MAHTAVTWAPPAHTSLSYGAGLLGARLFFLLTKQRAGLLTVKNESLPAGIIRIKLFIPIFFFIILIMSHFQRSKLRDLQRGE